MSILAGQYSTIGDYYLIRNLGVTGEIKTKIARTISTNQMRVLYILAVDSNEAERFCETIELLQSASNSQHLIRIQEFMPNQQYVKKSGGVKLVHMASTEAQVAGNLYDVLYNNRSIQYDGIVQYFITIIRGCQELVQNSFPINHLTPLQILLNIDFQIKINPIESQINKQSDKHIPYLAPEVLEESENVNQEKALVFSLGVLLFFFIAHRMPHDRAEMGDKNYGMMHNHSNTY